jgi:hypothetical protein
MHRLFLSLLLVLGTQLALATGVSAQGAPHCEGALELPRFTFGFAALEERVGPTMGTPVSCEYADPNGSGDTLQDTTTGLAFWRKATNTATFTNGWDHWAISDMGQVHWTDPSIDPPANARLLDTSARALAAPPPSPPDDMGADWAPATRTKTSGCVASAGLPDQACTPGALNPDVTPTNVQSTICVAGFSRGVRPPVSVTGPLKRELMTAYGFAGADPAAFELDHLISLELGGAPREPANLWPEASDPRPGFHEKDQVENYLHKQVCSGATSLRQAQSIIVTDWRSVYKQLHP